MDLEAMPTRPHMHGNPTQMDTQYVNMMLALDDISMMYSILASFSAWILLAGFILFPGTFSSLQKTVTNKVGTGAVPTNVIDRVTFIVAWACTGIGALGKLWLWWRWRKNYIFALNKIFLPGLMHSLAGVLSTLSNVVGAQGAKFSATSKLTIFVTSGSTVVFGVLTAFYSLWLVRRVKARHDREVGKQKASKHGEGKVYVSTKGV
ncbi:hypothetical protein HYPSUDRAFT_45441 [Hypholoma sublateritium FD-334 SS-4]|uniref:Uncharacterized protein n=1 Tax=Hypholoma sublateritium (strain FD-334 SS-4) TaxID=945553 RepID=A0A0D2PDH2_HYPSF|nr:hypothetical protein HYPSUDRAFT_45441 [Hypholoma sublateritium FD-334 SS-4]